jgi:hypothetical protein
MSNSNKNDNSCTSLLTPSLAVTNESYACAECAFNLPNENGNCSVAKCNDDIGISTYFVTFINIIEVKNE